MGQSVMLIIITFSNIHLDAIGFLEYCRYMLLKFPDLIFIAMLCSNISSLEAFFSLMYFYGSDSATAYKQMNIVDNRNSMRILKCNKIYKSNAEKYFSTGLSTLSKSKEREKVISDHERFSESDDLVDTFDINKNG